jgi:hypothetical protein
MNNDELPEELKQQVEAKFNTVLKAFLQSCTKDRRKKVTQFREPNFSELITSTSSAPTAPEVRSSEPKYDDIVDPYPTHANYATMMDDHNKVIDNNLLTTVNMIMARFDKLEGKTTDGNPSGVDSSSKNPEFGMALNFYDNQGLYAVANKGKSVSSAIEIDKTSLAGSAPSNQVVVYSQNSARNTRTDQRPATNRASVGQNILPNPLKSPSQVPILDDTPAAPVAPSTDFNDTLNRFRKKLSKSLEESLGVQIKPSMTTYRKPYPSHFDFMKAPNGWKVPNFNKFSGDDSKSTMEHISMFLAQLGEASAYDFMKVHNFPLSLTSIAFAWFTSLPACSIGSWDELGEKFHSHFYTGIHETRLSHLASVHQGHDESVLDFVK